MFKLTKIQNGRINVPEPLVFPVGSADIKAGEALNLSAGKLIAATGKPSYIAFADAKTGESVSVYKVTPDMIFETAFTAEPKDITVGLKVTNTSLGVTATTTNGTATIIDLLGATAVGDKVLVIFE